MTVSPASENTGVVFHIEGQRIPAHFSFVEQTFYCTILSARGQKVKTVEHFLSAVFALGIDNLEVSLTAQELPCLDGSCTDFYWGLLSAGLKKQKARKLFAYISQKVELSFKESTVSIEPADSCCVSLDLDYQIPVAKETPLSITFDLFKQDYFSEIARARTYGFKEDLEFFEHRKLAQGVTLENCLVMNHTEVLSPGGRRFHSEMVRHKTLDVFGDMFLLGHRFIGHYRGYRPSHHLNYLLVKEVSDKKAYHLKEYEQRLLFA